MTYHAVTAQSPRLLLLAGGEFGGVGGGVRCVGPFLTPERAVGPPTALGMLHLAYSDWLCIETGATRHELS